MKYKSTAELRHEIKSATRIEDFLTANKGQMTVCSLPEHLNALLAQKRLSRAEVVRGSLLDKAYVYQIFSGDKVPSRDKLLALAFGLCLTDDETQKMLKASGNRELYSRDQRDALILFALHRNQNIFEVNELLTAHGHKALCAVK
ncbi:MAG: helix-turn-helix domain-containing protein [Clostridiales bacterium]|jgi:transcriptional regulator with XRE-family HTH domain|nr:helix-turn-helix domain-containing protein [Clostridiales bacterium]